MATDAGHMCTELDWRWVHCHSPNLVRHDARRPARRPEELALEVLRVLNMLNQELVMVEIGSLELDGVNLIALEATPRAAYC